jgi:cob(I)alamin adenosyltransferase
MRRDAVDGLSLAQDGLRAAESAPPSPPMSIVTRTGDAGLTGLMYNRRVSKCHPRVEAYGSVDELNAALGLARAHAPAPFVADSLLRIQQDLVTLMGELATGVDDLERYVKDGFQLVTADFTAKLDVVVTEIEAQNVSFKGWATPGATVCSAALDVARTTCRRAERRVVALHEAGQLSNPEIIVFLNRLSDLLWLMARWVETKETGKAE